MARTITVIGADMHVFGDFRCRILDFNITSYTTGGESLTPAEAGLEAIEGVFAVPKGLAAAALLATYDTVNNKLIVSGQTPTSATAGTIALDQMAAAATARFLLLVLGK